MRIEDEALQRRGRVALWRGHALDDGLEHFGNAGAFLRRHEEHLFARDGQHVLEIVHDGVGLGRRQVDLVDDGDNH